MRNKNNKIYTVSQINSLIKELLENNLPGRLKIRGEITDFRPHQSGHRYFSLKDKVSKIPCVMWKSSLGRLKFEPENGQEVLGTGFIEVYVPHGKYQFIVDRLAPAGVGDLQLAFEQMVKRLGAQGLFDESHKKALPAYPERIGILTSESGAAIGDIKNSIHNRWPCTKLFLYPVPVQGEEAAEKIAMAIGDINRRNKKMKLDILIVGRGGGSREDLWAFNEEVLARAIFDSAIPVISAVGHEYDTTIADLTADARASTPTKAGVIAVPDMLEILDHLAGIQSRLGDKIEAMLKLAKQNLEIVLAGAIFKRPMLLVRNREQQLDELGTGLIDSIKQMLIEARTKLHNSYYKVTSIEPHRLLGRKTVDLNNLQNRARTAVNAIINRGQIQLTGQMNRLAGLDPKLVLQRGYSITTNKNTGKVVTKSEDVEIGDMIVTKLAEKNLIESEVKIKQNKRSRR
ncbi:MAG: exodeoxyribonuclease VII large subunit [Planctomycetota bacterium]|jgi:exodeoxyribonuclease VII large subunit